MEGKARFFFRGSIVLLDLTNLRPPDKTLKPVMARKQAEQVARFRVTKATHEKRRDVSDVDSPNQ